MSRAVLLAGHAGVGKTTVARQICTMMHWAMLDKDTLCGCATRCTMRALGGDPDDRDSEMYRQVVRPVEYETLLNTALDVVGSGVGGVVLVAPFVPEVRSALWLDAHQFAFERVGATMETIWVTADVGVMRRRLTSRGLRRDEHKLRNWDSYVAGLPGPPAGVLTLDTSVEREYLSDAWIRHFAAS